MQKRLKAAGKFCTGCGACANACPIDAIEMVEDAYGFFQAQIRTDKCMHCDVCQRICSVLNVKKEVSNAEVSNAEDPYASVLECMAVMAEDEVRFHSSSGGAFWVLAEKMLEMKGKVAGAAFYSSAQDDRYFEVRHLLIEQLSQLCELQKSKYTQSKTGLIYREVRDALELGNPVLFCGCPCQVAGLTAYLGKEYEKLVTVDLLCHGVPSQKMLNESLAGLAEKRPIAKIDFRDKNYGWESLGMTISYADGARQRLSYDESRYEQGFHPNMTLNNSCYDCIFCEFPRQGDLTCGDFWGIGEYETDSHTQEALDDGMGTSLIFINTQKGKKYFDSVRDRFRMCMDVPPVYAKNNRIHARIKKDTAREQFLALYPERDFNTAVLYAQQRRADIGIVGNWSYPNYGSELTYYALYRTIKGMGKSVLMIGWPKRAEWKPSDQAQLFDKQPYASYEIAPLVQTRSELRKLNERCAMFVLGSDQLLNNNLYHWMDKFMQLDWVCSSKRKIAYAASFGYDYIWGGESDREELAYFLRRFDAFSVREKSGVLLAKKHYGVSAQMVPDPIFLLPVTCYEQLVANVPEKDTQKPFLFSYILDTSKEKADILKECADTLHVRLTFVPDRSKDAVTSKNMWDIRAEDSLSVEAWLSEIKNCKYMVTDSFHGMCFAILFHKPFLAVCNESRGSARFTSLLEELGLQNRLVKSIRELREKKWLLSQPADYDSVQKKIDQMAARGYLWLEEALNGSPKEGFSDYDILAGRAYELEKEVRKSMESAQDRMNRQDAVDIKQWEQLEDHRKRLDGLDGHHIYQTEQLEYYRKRLDSLDERHIHQTEQLEVCGKCLKEHGTEIEKQKEQLAEYKDYLDSLDAGCAELNRLIAEIKQEQEKRKHFVVYFCTVIYEQYKKVGRMIRKWLKK